MKRITLLVALFVFSLGAYAQECNEENEYCEPESYCGDGILDEGEQCDDGNDDNGDGCSAVCLIEGGDEGCTPGYWKQSHHFDSWPLPYTPDTPFGSVFEDAFPGKTLLEVMWTGGGGKIALGRHTVAALLNSASEGVDYPISEADVINMFNDVYPSDKKWKYNKKKKGFEEANEQGCPLN